jgi:hypothetical protein
VEVGRLGCTGARAAEWEVLLSDDETTAWVEELIRSACGAFGALVLQGATGRVGGRGAEDLGEERRSQKL